MYLPSATRDGDAQLLAYCRARVAAVIPAAPTSVRGVLDALEQHRQRPVEIVIGHPVDIGLPSGLWLRMRERDVIWVDQRTSPMHRLVIIGHESGHMICGHEPAEGGDQPTDLQHLLELASHQMLGLSSQHLAAIVGHCRGEATRERADWRREREAEVTGRLLTRQLLGEDPARVGASLAEL